MQEANAQRHNVTIDSITAQLDEDRALARNEKQASAAITATMGKAKLHGLVSDKLALSGKNEGPVQVHLESAREKLAALLGIAPNGEKVGTASQNDLGN